MRVLSCSPYTKPLIAEKLDANHPSGLITTPFLLSVKTENGTVLQAITIESRTTLYDNTHTNEIAREYRRQRGVAFKIELAEHMPVVVADNVQFDTTATTCRQNALCDPVRRILRGR
jgi:hypothetical protein